MTDPHAWNPHEPSEDPTRKETDEQSGQRTSRSADNDRKADQGDTEGMDTSDQGAETRYENAATLDHSRDQGRRRRGSVDTQHALKIKNWIEVSDCVQRRIDEHYSDMKKPHIDGSTFMVHHSAYEAACVILQDLSRLYLSEGAGSNKDDQHDAGNEDDATGARMPPQGGE